MLLSNAALSINLIGAHVDDSSDGFANPASFQDNMRAKCVVHRERQAVSERIVHVRLHIGIAQKLPDSNMWPFLLTSFC